MDEVLKQIVEALKDAGAKDVNTVVIEKGQVKSLETEHHIYQLLDCLLLLDLMKTMISAWLFEVELIITELIFLQKILAFQKKILEKSLNLLVEHLTNVVMNYASC